MKDIFIVDAETDGLYGKFLSIAAAVYDRDWNEKEIFYGAVRYTREQIKEKWVLENVYDCLKNARVLYNSEQQMLDAFWAFWMKYREGSLCFADVPYPVESRLFLQCVQADAAERSMQAPYPIIDIASLLYSKGFDPLADRLAIADIPDLVRHDALDDVKIIKEILRRLL